MSVESAVQHEVAPDLDHNIGLVVDRVSGIAARMQLTGVDEADIRLLVEQEWQQYADAPVQHFVPVLVQRAVIERLNRRPKQ